MKASIMLNNFDLSKAIDNSDPVVTPMPPAPCGKAIECPKTIGNSGNQIFDAVVPIETREDNKVKESKYAIKVSNAFEMRTVLKEWNLSKLFLDGWHYPTSVINLGNDISFADHSHGYEIKEFDDWCEMFGIKPEKEEINKREFAIPKVGEGYYYSFDNKNSKEVLVISIGRMNDNWWTFKVLKQDERFICSEDSLKYTKNKFEIYSVATPGIYASAKGVCLRGSEKESNGNAYEFSTSENEVIEILESLEEWAKEWPGWYENLA